MHLKTKAKVSQVSLQQQGIIDKIFFESISLYSVGKEHWLELFVFDYLTKQGVLIQRKKADSLSNPLMLKISRLPFDLLHL